MKKLLVFVATLLLTVTLVSCHGSDGLKEFEMPDSLDETRTYEISFWAKNDTNVYQVAIYEKAIADFEKLYPFIKVNLKLYTDYGRIYEDVITNIPTSTTPNVCITYPDHIATYKTGKNNVVPLETLVNHAEYGLGGTEIKFHSPKKSEIVPKFLNECIIDDKLFALPFMRSTEACYINRDFVEKLGYTVPDTLTWDFIWEVSEKAMEKDEDGNFLVNGQKVLIPFIYKSTDNMMIHLLKQKNAPFSTSEGEIGLFNDTTRALLTELYSHGKTRAFSTFKISSYPANFLNAGQCIFAIDSTAGATWMGSGAPNIDISEDALVDFETVVRPIPQYDVNDKKMISQGPSLCLFNKEDSEEVLASWIFMQYLLTNEVQISYSQTEGYAPVTTLAQNSREYKEYLDGKGNDGDLHYSVKIDATRLLIDNTENTFVTPVFNGSATLRNEAGQLIENTVKSARRKESIEGTYFDDLFATAEQNIKKTTTFGKEELGELPATSKALIITLAIIWIVLILGFTVNWVKERKKNSRNY